MINSSGSLSEKEVEEESCEDLVSALGRGRGKQNDRNKEMRSDKLVIGSFCSALNFFCQKEILMTIII